MKDLVSPHYKPRLVRSGNGFVTSLIVPEGNAADSIKLEPAIRDSIGRTGVIATLVSTDDGYAPRKSIAQQGGGGCPAISGFVAFLPLASR